MPSYKINERNSFEIQGRLFFVARTRYRDDGMQVFENTKPYITPINGYWGYVLNPDYARKLTCREVARRMVQAWLDCKYWQPTPEQLKKICETDQHGLYDGAGSVDWYRKWYAHFHPNPQT